METNEGPEWFQLSLNGGPESFSLRRRLHSYKVKKSIYVHLGWLQPASLGYIKSKACVMPLWASMHKGILDTSLCHKHQHTGFYCKWFEGNQERFSCQWLKSLKSHREGAEESSDCRCLGGIEDHHELLRGSQPFLILHSNSYHLLYTSRGEANPVSQCHTLSHGWCGATLPIRYDSNCSCFIIFIPWKSWQPRGLAIYLSFGCPMPMIDQY